MPLDNSATLRYILPMKNMNFTATIEFLPGQGAAIVALFDGAGEWSGAGRIEVRSRRHADLYDEGYRYASRAVACKGGTLDRYRAA